MKSTFEIRHLFNNHKTRNIEMMYYDEDNIPQSIEVAKNSTHLNTGIDLPTSNFQDEYENGNYVTFRFPNQPVKAWVRVFLLAGDPWFTTQENPDWEDRELVPNLLPGHSFIINFPLISFLDKTYDAIWVIGTVDTMPGIEEK